MASFASYSGLALQIRQADNNETIDLDGSSLSTVESNFTSAFSEPFPHAASVPRITFIVGGGKLCRGKYHADTFKTVATVLRAAGYLMDSEGGDEGAGGAFKSHHDTNKNLKTVVVFPKLAAPSAKLTATTESGEIVLDGEGIYNSSSPDYMVACSSLAVFKRLLSSKAPTWSEKKALLSNLEETQSTITGFDSKLMKGTSLSELEQKVYDSVEDLDAKMAEVKTLLAAHVEAGQLTASEKALLLDQVEEKLAGATEAKKAKIVENLTKRKELVESSDGKFLPPLKAEAHIAKVRTEMIPLKKIEAAAGGRLMTIKETAAMGKLLNLEEEIARLELNSRGWFESDELFDARCALGRVKFEKQLKKPSSSSSKKGSSGGSSSNSAGGKYVAKSTTWVTPNATKNLGRPAVKKAVAKPAGRTDGGLFAAMMDSDSDSDSD